MQQRLRDAGREGEVVPAGLGEAHLAAALLFGRLRSCDRHEACGGAGNGAFHRRSPF